AVCVRLGFWQLDRLEWRTERNRAVAERLAQPTLPITSARLDTTGLTYRRVELRGEFDETRSFVLAGRTFQGMPGVHVVSPLRLENGDVVLVNRGWVRAPDAATVDLRPFRVEGPVRLTGIIVPSSRSGHPVSRTAGPVPARRSASPLRRPTTMPRPCGSAPMTTPYARRSRTRSPTSSCRRSPRTARATPTRASPSGSGRRRWIAGRPSATRSSGSPSRPSHCAAGLSWSRGAGRRESGARPSRARAPAYPRLSESPHRPVREREVVLHVHLHGLARLHEDRLRREGRRRADRVQE